jgi:hypothetical protein
MSVAMNERSEMQEETAKAVESYYRIAATRRTEGEVITGPGTRPLAASEAHIEDILEAHRPKNCPDRGNSVYMRRDKDFATVGVPFDMGFVHTIEPLAEVFQRDLTWIGLLQRRHHQNPSIKKNLSALDDRTIALNYWNGAAGDKPVWEWVTTTAKVVAVDDEFSPVRPNSKFLDQFKPRSNPHG